MPVTSIDDVAVCSANFVSERLCPIFQLSSVRLGCPGCVGVCHSVGQLNTDPIPSVPSAHPLQVTGEGLDLVKSFVNLLSPSTPDNRDDPARCAEIRAERG